MDVPVVYLDPEIGDVHCTLVQRCTSIQGEVAAVGENITGDLIEGLRQRYLVPLQSASTGDLSKELELITTLSVIIDLIAQGWTIKETSPRVALEFRAVASNEAEKERTRRAHVIERDAQLREPSVLAFVRGMEKRRSTPTGWHSIFSLMRDGRELASALKCTFDITDEQKRAEALGAVISPYLQFVEPDSVCEHTGLRLNDIWRYFRHTWVTSYKSVPGRSVMILVRDAAAPNHPVIGVASIGSSVVQQSSRDRWIGWDEKTAIERIRRLPARKATAVLISKLESFIAGVYTKDLLAEGVVSRSDINRPSETAISTLLAASQEAIKQHRLYPHAAKHKQDASGATEFQERAQTQLFRSKRCVLLAKLLGIKRMFQVHGLDVKKPKLIIEAFKNGRFRTAVGQLVRLTKGERVGINMMDITICGAVAPYNVLLGGKLICFLLCSPEVTRYYAQRYGRQVSVIASAMRGAIVQRPAQLVLLCTTSLYGSPLNQYSRVKLPAVAVGGRIGESISYDKLGMSEGFGSFHFSRETLRLMGLLIGRSKQARKVNSIFGEGVNPLMRKIREALTVLGLPADELLRHGNKRVVYGVPLARNFREVLLGLADKPEYLIPQTNTRSRSELIATYWIKRWLLNRLQRPGILDEVAKHNLVYPIRHGAQVPLESTATDSLGLWAAGE